MASGISIILVLVVVGITVGKASQVERKVVYIVNEGIFQGLQGIDYKEGTIGG